MKFTVIIPARYASNRLPAKPLADIHGKPMVVHVMERALASGAERVIVATDHADILDAVKKARGEVCFTRSDHQSGTERLAEVIEHYGFEDNDIILNVQGDEPLIPSCIIQQVAENLTNCTAEMATLAVPINHSEEVFNPHVVKVGIDAYGYALYFSRAPISGNGKPYHSAKHEDIEGHFLRHIGIYAYRAGFIRRYVAWAPCESEKIESLEQLRVLSRGEKIHVALAKKAPAVGIDTPEDLQKVRSILSGAQ